MSTTELNFTQKGLPDLVVGMHRDTDTRSLYLRVSPTSRTWSWYGWSRADKAPLRVSLGAWPKITVQAARAAAVGLDADNAKGRALRPEKAAVEAPAAPQGMTFAEAVRRYGDKLEADDARTLKWVDDAFRLGFDKWTGRQMDSVAKLELLDRIAEIRRERGPGAARTAQKCIKALYSYVIDVLEVKMSNPTAKLKMPRQDARQETLDADDKAAFFAALDREPSEHLRPFFRLLLATGCRRSNLEQAEWSEINLRTRQWIIPAAKSKNKKVMLVPLRPVALEILRELKHKEGAHPQWVFESPLRPGQHLGSTWIQFKRIAKAAGLPTLVPHDLRRTFGSDLLAGGVSVKNVSLAMGHAEVSTTLRHYITTTDKAVASEIDRVPAW